MRRELSAATPCLSWPSEIVSKFAVLRPFGKGVSLENAWLSMMIFFRNGYESVLSFKNVVLKELAGTSCLDF